MAHTPIQQTLRNITRLPVKTSIREAMAQALSEQDEPEEPEYDDEEMSTAQRLAEALSGSSGREAGSHMPLNGIGVLKAALGDSAGTINGVAR